MKCMDKFFNREQEGYYYDVGSDIELFNEIDPAPWCLIVIGGRGTGKTYSTLKYCTIENHIKFSFIKRTNDEVKIMCQKDRAGTKLDLSPFKPLNRDFGTNTKALQVEKGIGGFYEEHDGKLDGVPLGYIFSLNAIGTIRGMGTDDIEIQIFDEFIPSIYAKVMRGEGDQFLDLYKTTSRDREHRGRKPLLSICLANAYRLSNPLIDTLELTDTIAYMKINNYSYYCDNGIMIHLLDDNEEFRQEEEETAIMRSMKNTQWGSMALDNNFAYDDLTCIGHTSLKRYRCITGFIYKRKPYFVYQRENGNMYICRSQGNCNRMYDLSREVEQQAFYFEQVITIKDMCIQDRVLFSDYVPYNIIMNYKKLFKVG